MSRNINIKHHTTMLKIKREKGFKIKVSEQFKSYINFSERVGGISRQLLR
jgi:hypothetical protein